MSYELRRLKFLADKFSIPNARLELAGHNEQTKGETLNELVRLHEKDMEKGQMLAWGSTQFKGQGLRLWYSVRK